MLTLKGIIDLGFRKILSDKNLLEHILVCNGYKCRAQANNFAVFVMKTQYTLIAERVFVCEPMQFALDSLPFTLCREVC